MTSVQLTQQASNLHVYCQSTCTVNLQSLLSPQHAPLALVSPIAAASIQPTDIEQAAAIAVQVKRHTSYMLVFQDAAVQCSQIGIKLQRTCACSSIPLAKPLMETSNTQIAQESLIACPVQMQEDIMVLSMHIHL